MLKLLLLGALFLSGQEASLDCSSLVSASTQTVRGPAGVAVALEVSSEDDHAKDTHDCMAKYRLMVLPATGRTPVSAYLLDGDAEWGRKLSVHLDGFSPDGKRVLGIIAQGGSFPFTMLFDYDVTTGVSKLVDLKMGLNHLMTVKCGTTFAVAGTTGTGAIVLAPNTGNQCSDKYRWVLDPKSGGLQPLPQGSQIIGLYKVDVP
jgi:hypothetical protein